MNRVETAGFRINVSSKARRLLWIACCTAGLVHLAAQAFLFLPLNWAREDEYRDVMYVYAAAERVRTGQPLYQPWPDYGPHVHTSMGPPYTTDRFPYPPFVATVLAPATALPFTTYARLWYLPLVAAFWVYAWTLARLAARRVDAWTVLVAGLVLGLFPGTYRAMGLGQIDPLLWAAFGIALVVPALRGAAFAASAAVKLYAAWPLLFAARREGMRVVAPAFLLLAVLTLLSGLVLGFGVYLDWARWMLPVISQATFNNDNVSLSFAGLRLVRVLGWDYSPGPLPLAARLYLMVIGIGAPLLVGWKLRMREPAMQYACVGTAAVVFAPLCWSSYLPLLLTPLALALRSWREDAAVPA